MNLTRLNLSCNQINNLTGESDSYDRTLMNKSGDISIKVSFVLLTVRPAVSAWHRIQAQAPQSPWQPLRQHRPSPAVPAGITRFTQCHVKRRRPQQPAVCFSRYERCRESARLKLHHHRETCSDWWAVIMIPLCPNFFSNLSKAVFTDCFVGSLKVKTVFWWSFTFHLNKDHKRFYYNQEM